MTSTREMRSDYTASTLEINNCEVYAAIWSDGPRTGERTFLVISI
jgi:hypothetical protein